MESLKMEEITPEKLMEIDAKSANARLQDLTLAQLKELSEQRISAKINLERLELECSLRAMRAHSLGFSKKNLATIFNVTSNTITKWIG